MYRARFFTDEQDYRPITWPIKHPYWCTGSRERGDINQPCIVAYVDNAEQLLELWPDAVEIDLGNEVTEYLFTDRFPKPDWFGHAERSE